MLIFPNNKPGPVSVDARPALDRLIREEEERFRRLPATRSALRRFRSEMRDSYTGVLNTRVDADDVVVRVTWQDTQYEGFRVSGRVLSRRGVGDVIPALWIVPDHAAKKGPATLVVHGTGKGGLFKKGRPGSLLTSLLKAGQRVLAVDVVGVGDTSKAFTRSIRDTSDPVFYAFNPSLLSLRVQDVLTSLAALQAYEKPKSLGIHGVGEGARWALLALPMAKRVRAAAMDFSDTDTTETGWHGGNYHPMILKVGGFRTAIALASPVPLLLAGADRKLAAWARAVYGASGEPKRLRLGRISGSAIVGWNAPAG
jgi:dienelactone hydrolase